MNEKTAKLLNRLASTRNEKARKKGATTLGLARKAKREWNTTPRPERGGLRRQARREIAEFSAT